MSVSIFILLIISVCCTIAIDISDLKVYQTARLRRTALTGDGKSVPLYYGSSVPQTTPLTPIALENIENYG
jgi:hypothetical protein